MTYAFIIQQGSWQTHLWDPCGQNMQYELRQLCGGQRMGFGFKGVWILILVLLLTTYLLNLKYAVTISNSS